MQECTRECKCRREGEQEHAPRVAVQRTRPRCVPRALLPHPRASRPPRSRAVVKMAKSKNHTNHNQNYKNHRNGIKKPRFNKNVSTKGVRPLAAPRPTHASSASASAARIRAQCVWCCLASDSRAALDAIYI